MLSKTFIFLTVFLCAYLGPEVFGYDCIKRPKVRYPFCQDRNEARKGHTMCLGSIHQRHMNDTVRHELAKMHESMRTNVNPPAADMITMEHNTLLEKEAQIWAEQCKLTHDKEELRFLANRFTVGQNIFVGGPVFNFTEVIENWGSEKIHFKYGSHNNISAVRNYAQMIWAKTYLFGCGVSKCGSNYFYVCNYAPSMNVSEISTPYTASVSGSWCDSCKSNCDNVTSKQCDCRGKLCLNGGQLNLTTCRCECIKEVHTYDSQYCELVCDPSGDDPKCGTPPYENSTCGKSSLTDFHCPWMCDICPYADTNYTESSVLLPWERGLPMCTTSTTTTTTTTPSTTTSSTMSTGVSTKTKLISKTVSPAAATKTSAATTTTKSTSVATATTTSAASVAATTRATTITIVKTGMNRKSVPHKSSATRNITLFYFCLKLMALHVIYVMI